MKTRRLFLLGTVSLASVATLSLWPPAPSLPKPAARSRPATASARLPELSLDPGAAVPALVEPAAALLPQPDFAKIEAFASWLDAWQAAPPEARAGRVKEGVKLAGARRAEFKALIMTDPRRAIELAVPRVLRQELPESIVARLETPVSTTGEFELRVSTPSESAPPEWRSEERTIRTAGETFHAYTYGAARSLWYQRDLPVRGVAIDGELALAENPVRRLEAGERIPAGVPVVTECPVSGESTTSLAADETIDETTPAVEVGGEIVVACEPDHVAGIEVQYAYGTLLSDGAPTTYNSPGGRAKGPRTGTFRWLYIPVAFADDPRDPVTPEQAQLEIDRSARFWAEASFGKMKAQGTLAPVVRLPFTRAAHEAGAGGDDTLHTYAYDAVRAMGIDARNYEAIGLRVSGFGGGVAWGYRSMINGSGTGIIIHELGHVLGLRHAEARFAAGDLPYDWNFDNGGDDGDKGSPFDYMGRNYEGGLGAHYHSMAKRRLGWLGDENVAFAGESDGVFRLHAIDQPRLEPGGAHALRAGKDELVGTVLEYRANHPQLPPQVTVMLDRPGWGKSPLVDTTPESHTGDVWKDYWDAGLTVGRTYSDLESDQHFTVLSENNTDIPSVDVAYRRGPFPGNTAPAVSLAASATSVNPGDAVTFTATASDAEGDALAYHWDFSDGTTAANRAVVTRRFPITAHLTAMLTVSDMKGKTTRRHVVVQVGAHGKQLVTGTITAGGQPLPNVRVAADGRHAFTDADGNYALAGVSAGWPALVANLRGYTFEPLFPNPMDVVGGTNTAHWSATGATFVSLSKTADIVEGAGAGSFTLARTGSAEAALDVYVAKPTGSATFNVDYTVLPAPVVDPSAERTGYWRFTIPAGAPSLAVTVTATNDTIQEGGEAVRFQLGAGPGYETVVASSAELSLQDDDIALPRVTVTSSDPVASESGDAGSFTFTRRGPTAAALGLNVTWGGTAANGADYSPLPATVQIPAGQASVTVAVQPLEDAASEPIETVIPSLAPGSYVVGVEASSATVKVTDNDGQVISLEVTDQHASESGSGRGVFLVRRSGDTSAGQVVSYSLSGTAVEGADYQALAGSVVFPAGATSVPVMVVPIDDDLGERTETVTLHLSPSSTGDFRLAPVSQGTIGIEDSPDLPIVRLRLPNGSEGAEGGDNATVAIRAVGTIPPGGLVVNYSLAGSAAAGADYTPPSGSVTLSGSVEEVFVEIPVLEDNAVEGTESLVVSLDASAAYRIGSDPATLAIRDNENDGTRVAVSRRNASNGVTEWSFGIPVAEGGAAGSFYFSRNGTWGNLTVTYSITGTAVAGTDHTGLTGSVVIPDGSSGVAVNFTPVNDSEVEETETVIATVIAGTGYGVDLLSSATVEIRDNDTTVSASFAGAQTVVSESAGTSLVAIPVTLSAPAVSPVVLSVDIASASTANAGSTAIGHGVDWTFVDPANGDAPVTTATLVFPAGSQSGKVWVRVFADDSREPAEFATLELKAVKGVAPQPGASTHQLVIIEDAGTGIVKEERWSSGAVYQNGTWDSVAPSVTRHLAGFTSDQNVGDGFSRRLSGLIVAPVTGNYRFWIASDDASRLYLSTTASPQQKVQIARVDTWTSFQNWTANLNQQSDYIPLQAGQAYYLEAQHQEAGGGDHVSVAWEGPGFARIPLVLDWISPRAPATVRFAATASAMREDDPAGPRLTVVLDQPAGTTPVSVSFTVSGTASAGSDYLVTGSSMSFAPGEQAKQIPLSLVADALGEAAEAIVVTLHDPVGVTLDSPSIHRLIVTDATAPAVETRFAEAGRNQSPGTTIATLTATPAAGRAITGWSIIAGNAGNAFAIGANGLLTLANPSALPNPGSLKLVVRAVDNSGTSGDGVVNLACNATANRVIEERWEYDSGFVNDHWSDAPFYSGGLPAFTTPQGVGDRYSRRLTGYLRPQVGGDYTFWLAGDDQCRLYLSSDSSPSRKTQIAGIGEATNFQQWDKEDAQRSVPIALEAGKVYWIEAHHVEGDGGDHLSVAWQGPGIDHQAIPSSAFFPRLPGTDFETPVVPPAVALVPPVGGAALSAGSDIALAAEVVVGSVPVTRVEFYRGSIWIGTDSSAPYAMTWNHATAGEHVLTAKAVYPGGGVTSSAVEVTVVDPDPAADPDGDGFSTGLEKAVGTGPYSAASRPSPLHAGLLAWWKLDDGAGLIAGDSTGFARDGAVAGAAWVQGTSGGALQFDGVNDSVGMPAGLLGNRPAFTMAGWYRSPRTSGSRIGLWGQNDAVEFGIDGSNLSLWTPGGGNVSAPLPAPDLWHHVACVGDGTSLKIYLDGVLANSGGSATGNYGSSTFPFRIGGGGIWDGTGNHFNGSIDDVRVYARALSAGEIAGLVRAPVLRLESLAAFASEDLAFLGHLEVENPSSAQPLSYSKVSGPDWLRVAPDGALTGTPALSDIGGNIAVVRVAGGGGHVAEGNLSIIVNAAPRFWVAEMAKVPGSPGSPYAGTLAGSALDREGDALTFMKLSGPGWLAVAPDGGLSGQPLPTDVGENRFVVRVADVHGASAVGLLIIPVDGNASYPADHYGSLAGTSTRDEFIRRVRIADLDHDSGNNGGYADFREKVARIDPGQTVAYTLTPGWTDTRYGEAWAVWIDLNRDGDFGDAGEKVISLGSAETERAGSFVVPATAALGATRMRVAMKYGSVPANPTGTFNWGEVEDYSVQVGLPPPPNAAPYFLADPIVTAPGATLAGRAADWEGHPLSFSKVSGPAWLSVAPDGRLSGIPPAGGGPAEAVVRVTDSAGGDDTAVLSLVGTGDVFSHWAAANGLSGAAVGAEADPDGDGLANGIEFVVGGDPSDPASNALQPVAGGDATHFELSFRRTDESAVYSPHVEYGSSLAGWTVAESGRHGVVIVEQNDHFAAGVDRVTVRIPRGLAAGGKLFARLRVDIP